MAVMSRKGREVARLHGEVEPAVPVAHPLPQGERGIITPPRQPGILVQREVHHHHHAASTPVAPRSVVPGWVRVAALVMCIVLVVYVMLIVSQLMHPGVVPWQPKGGAR